MATDWNALELEFVNGAMTYGELAQKHGLKEGTVRQRANRNEWVEKRNALSQSVTSKAQENLSEKRVDELTQFNQDDLKVAVALREQISKAILIKGEELSPQELRALAGAHEAAQRVGRLALGATTENTGLSSPKGGPIQTSDMTSAEFEKIAKQVAGEI